MAQATEIVPTAEDAAAAAQALEQLASGDGELVRRVTLVRSDGTTQEHANVHLDVSEDLARLLVRLLAHLADGHGAVLIRKDGELTTQETADLLNVSRPHVVKLIETGKLAAHRVGTHRRVRLDDALAYQRRQTADAKAALEELAHEAQELELGY
jgi:excisionase family DNA binding protein